MERSLEGQTALVTGGGKGIGLAIATCLIERGARVAISGRHQGTLVGAATKLGASARAFAMDVRDEDSVKDEVAAVVDWAGGLDILVNNAGIGLLETPFVETTADQWRDVIDTNLTGVFVVTQAAWPHLVASKGQILNVSSIAGSQGFPGASAYCASKFGLNGLTEVLKKEGAALGVRALAICPGAVDTDIWEADWASHEVRARMMTPNQVAQLAAEMLATPRNIDLGPWIVVNSGNPWSA